MTRILIPLNLRQAEVTPHPAAQTIVDLSGRSMGTGWSVRGVLLPGMDAALIGRGIQAELDRLVAQMSHWEADSDLCRFNRLAAGQWQALPDDFFAVMDFALALARQSDGAFDPSMGALVNLWGFGPRAADKPIPGDVPTDAEIGAARARCGWQHLQMDRRRRALLQPGDVQLDLSAIAKGYGVDVMRRYLQRCQLPAALVELGGECSGFGVKPDGLPWWVEVETPPDLTSSAEQGAWRLALHGLSIATSGDYRRFFEQGGKRYAHNLDPRTGYAAAHDLASVSVVHESCMQADALSTVLTILGPEAGMNYARRYDVAALFMTRQAEAYRQTLSPALSAMLE